MAILLERVGVAVVSGPVTSALELPEAWKLLRLGDWKSLHMARRTPTTAASLSLHSDKIPSFS